MLTLATIITADSLISVGLLITLIGCTAIIVRTVSNIKRDIAELKDHQYTITAACEHALRLAIANPKMNVPDPRNPSELISVQRGGG